MRAQFTFTITGIAAKPDKTRGVLQGEADCHVLLATDYETAVARCSLENPVLVAQHKCSEAWNLSSPG